MSTINKYMMQIEESVIISTESNMTHQMDRVILSLDLLSKASI